MDDIKTMQDVETLVNAFYSKVQADDLIGPIFNDVAKVDWPSHLPRMYAFWGSVLLGESGFSGNPMRKHVLLNQQFKLKIAHFERWTTLWHETVGELFQGEVADLAKLRADSIRGIMEYKVQAD